MTSTFYKNSVDIITYNIISKCYHVDAAKTLEIGYVYHVLNIIFNPLVIHE